MSEPNLNYWNEFILFRTYSYIKDLEMGDEEFHRCPNSFMNKG